MLPIDIENPYRLSRGSYIYIYICIEFEASYNACWILLCWFIMIIWVLACNNTYRHDRHFVSVYCNSTILETDLIASKWFNTDLIQNLFIEIQRQEIILDINQYVNGKTRLHFLIFYILSVDAMGNILKDWRHVVKHLPTTSVISKMNIIE